MIQLFWPMSSGSQEHQKSSTGPTRGQRSRPLPILSSPCQFRKNNGTSATSFKESGLHHSITVVLCSCCDLNSKQILANRTELEYGVRIGTQKKRGTISGSLADLTEELPRPNIFIFCSLQNQHQKSTKCTIKSFMEFMPKLKKYGLKCRRPLGVQAPGQAQHSLCCGLWWQQTPLPRD